MEHLTIANFKYGLDTRRSELTSQPGTLVTAENGHINQGGQFEKRKAFTLFGKLFPWNFGLQETPTGFVTFGSRAVTVATSTRSRSGNVATLTFSSTAPYGNFAAVGNVITITGVSGSGYNVASVVVTAATSASISYANNGSNEGSTVDGGGTITAIFPTGVTYQRLKHYYNTFDSSLNPNMTGIVCSSAFNGNVFAVATFALNNVYDALIWPSLPAATQCFYNGNVILPNVLGKLWGTYVNASDDNNTLQASLYASAFPTYFPDSTFTCAWNGSGFAFATITGPVSADFTVTPSKVSGTGSLVVFTQSASADAVTAIGTIVTFFLVSGGSGNIATVKDDLGTTLNAATVNFNTSLLQTAIDLATSINNNTSVNGGYTAVASLADTSVTVAKVVVTVPTSMGVARNGKAFVINSTTIHVSPTAGGVGTVGNTNITAGSNGVAGVPALPQLTVLEWTNWTVNSIWSTVFTYNDISYTIGGGNICGIVPTLSMGMGNKLYMIAGNTYYFSALKDATKWEQQDTGAGFTPVTDMSSSPTDLVSMAPYQGKLAVFGRNNTQIWNINADPTLYSQSQNLQNIGTLAKLSVQALGDLDVLFLADTGIRSLRVRDSSLNAYVVDLGSPIDSLITATMISGGGTIAAAACAISDPGSGRYWLYLNGTIYVLSYFPTLKITAWSTYLPTYSLASVQTTFTPSKFLAYAGQVYVFDDTTKNIYVYGGSNNNTYDNCVATIELPWLDLKKPYQYKDGEKVNVSMFGGWDVFFGLDPRGGTVPEAVPLQVTPTGDEQTDSTFMEGSFGLSVRGTHAKFKAVSSAAWTSAALISGFTLQYNLAEDA